MKRIKWQRQGYNECYPTVIAMLAGVPKEEVVQVGLAGTPCTFWAETEGMGYRRQANMAVVRTFAPWANPQPLTRENIKRINPRDLETKRGILNMLIRDETGVHGHVMAVDRGIIWDPAGEVEEESRYDVRGIALAAILHSEEIFFHSFEECPE